MFKVIQTKNKPICLINVYLPTKLANSDNQYQENIDILQAMIDKYVIVTPSSSAGI